MKEALVPQTQLLKYLTAHPPSMLGLLVDANSKHAVVFIEQAVDGFRFINNRHPASSVPDEMMLTSRELLSWTDPQVHVATLAHISPEPVDLQPMLMASPDTLSDYRRDMEALRHTLCDRNRLFSLMKTHFRAFLLDTLTMMGLIHEEELAAQLTLLQKALLQAVRTVADRMLEELLPMEDFMHALDAYEALIAAKARSL